MRKHTLIAVALCAIGLMTLAYTGTDFPLVGAAHAASATDMAGFVTASMFAFAPLQDANAYERGREFGRKDNGGGGEPDMKHLAAGLKEATDQVKRFAEDAEKKLKAGELLHGEAKQAADEALVKFNELSARMTDAEQKLSRRGPSERPETKTTGQHVMEQEAVKSFLSDRARGKSRVSVEMKSITTVGGGGDGAAGALVEPTRVQGIVAPPERRMTVRDLLTPGRTASNSIQYVQETGFTNNAAAVAEKAQKPESTMTFEEVTAKVATIAHWVQASVQILDDAPQLESYIDGRLRYGLMYVEELELLKGAGTGAHLLGLIPQATAFVAPITVSGATMIDKVRLGMLQAVLSEYPASGIVMHPSDWARIELTKDSEGRYIIGNPQDGAAPRLWRLPVVETPAIDEDKFLTGAFKLGAQVFDREDANVLLSTEDRDNFIKNMVTIRGEERLALAVYRPQAFIYGDFGNIT